MQTKTLTSPDLTGSENAAFHQLSAEDRLRHLGAIIDSSEDAIFSTTLLGSVLSWNHSAERIYGYTAREMLGNSIFNVIPTSRVSELKSVMQEVERGQRPTSFETVRVRKDGATMHVYLTISPVLDSSGQLIGTSTIARDITDKKTTEEALRKKQQELEDFFENSVIGLHWVGPDGTILWANRAEMDLLGYSSDEYIGHHIAEFHADREVIDDILLRLGRKEKLHGYEARLKCKNGSFRDVLISSSVLWNENEFIHTRCFTLDVTERRQVEQALRQAEKMAAVGRLAATVAHEINNPLETVTNLLYLAKMANSLPEAKNCIGEAQTELKRISHLTRQTLGFFKDTTVPRCFDISELVTQLVSIYKTKIGSKDVRIETRLKPSPVLGREGQLRQVLSNLLMNALDASRPGKAILISARPVGNRVRLTVGDQGGGISPENRNRIYEPFFTTKENVGTGLGLWVTKEIVEKHGGKLQLKTSMVPGRSGTVFSVLLPQGRNTSNGS
jgi:PAS domain S-box-containing protein